MARPFLRKIHDDEFDLLDWQEITKSLCAHAHFEQTRIQLALAPEQKDVGSILADFDALDQLLQGDDFVGRLSSLFQKFQLPQGQSFYHDFSLLPKGKVLKLESINLSALIVEWAEEFHKYAPNALTSGYQPYASLPSKALKRYCDEVRKLIDTSGSLNYDKHPELKQLFRRQQQIESTIRSKIAEMSRDEEFERRLQHRHHDIIHDRYVLAMRSDSYRGDLGFIISKSSSGQTLYVEPFSIRDLSNKRLHLLAQIEEIIEKICQNYSETLASQFEDFSYQLEAMSAVDDLLARASFIWQNDLSRPVLTENPEIRLTQCFHPLISDPVRNDVHIHKDSYGIMISGPNTGGKTVLLKAIALSYLFFYKGLFVPAENATLYPFQNLFFFSHDHQNLAKGLSSFASEVESHLEMLRILSKQDQENRNSNLIIIDEIFNSTSSEEASSLAMALLEKVFQYQKTKVFISTHHQVLKTLTHKKKVLQSAHMEFDLERKQPTYKVQTGTPGSSLAFEIFESLSKPVESFVSIARRARDFHQTENLSYEQLLKELSNKKTEMERKIRETEKIKRELEEQKKSAEGLAYLEKEKITEKYEHQFKKILKELEQLKEETKSMDNFKNIDKRSKNLQQKFHTLSRIENEPRETPSSNRSFQDFSVGDDVTYLISQKPVKVLDLSARKQKIQVGQGVMRFWVSPHELDFNNSPQKDHFSSTVELQSYENSVEVDARGMRLEDFKDLIEKRLNYLLSGDLPYLSIIHGHGSGVLKSWLRNTLEKKKDFEWTSPEGNDGCTEIKLSQS